MILFLSAALRLRVTVSFCQNTEKPPAFAGGTGLGAVRELGEMYTPTVTVVK
jgi:hypothetical protein